MTQEEIFRFLKPNFAKMLRFGFAEEGEAFVYRETVCGQFDLTVRVGRDGSVRTELIDALTDEPYVLHLVGDAAGAFVGQVREAYFGVLQTIAARCFDREIFKSPVTRCLLARALERYGDEPEYLWEKFPDNAVLRRKDNRKWYGAILTVERRKLGLAGEGNAEILDVRADPERIPLLVDGKSVFGGWHMNKKHWISLPLDGSVPIEEILDFLETSRRIAAAR